jgi:hypothetical protein
MMQTYLTTSRQWLFLSLAFSAIVEASASTKEVVPPLQDHSLPDSQVSGSRFNAIRIFNSVHSAMRQWGSSLHHNGLSFYPLIIPEGNLLYHGDATAERPEWFDWLAFEIEHAENFAWSWTPCPNETDGSEHLELHDLMQYSSHGRVPAQHQSRKSEERLGNDHNDPAQHHLGMLNKGQDDKPGRGLPGPHDWVRGYLHTYRATRDLNLVYIDGQSAAKANVGTLDSQDYILLDWPIDLNRSEQWPGRHELTRATELCALATEWGIDGWIRMEAGFEVIYCDFSPGAGLEQVSALGQPFQNETSGYPDQCGGGPGGGKFRFPIQVGGELLRRMFSWMRAAASRYHGHVRGRVEIDFSGMVSAFAFGGGINTTNPDAARAELPRVVLSTREARRSVRDRLRDVVRERKGHARETVDWQAVVDSIVSRYGPRLAALVAPAMTLDNMRVDIGTLLNPFLNFPADNDLEDAYGLPLERCTDHYFGLPLARQHSWTPEDASIYAALRSVSEIVCWTLFDTRKELLIRDDMNLTDEDVVVGAQNRLRGLMDELRWSSWKDCGGCTDPSTICMVPLFPFGVPEDYYSPRCKNVSGLSQGYWQNFTRI